MAAQVSIGLDIGTSGARAVAVDPEGVVRGSAAAPYRLDSSTPGKAEQAPSDWWEAACRVLSESWRAAGEPDLAGIGLSGQMHGTVLVDEQLAPLRPALLWCDGRSAGTAAAVEREHGREWLIAAAGNPPLPGFTAPQLRFLAERGDPALGRARWVLCAKDFVRAQLTGVPAAEHSDASGTGLYSPATGGWSEELAAIYGVDPGLLPHLVESGDRAGALTAAAAHATGLPAGTPVAGGAADNAAAAVGAGVADPGDLLISIGTSGTLLAPLAGPEPDPSGACHLFRSALPGSWYAMAVALDAGGALSWWQQVTGVPFAELAAEAAAVPPGSAGAVALPYLSGRRMPEAGPAGHAALTGLSLAHGRGHITRSLIEGAAYALADGLDCLQRLGVKPAGAVLTGGATGHPIWREAVALALPALRLERALLADCAALGAALLGFAASGRPLAQMLTLAHAPRESALPEPGPARAAIADGYARFRALASDRLVSG